jgi:hypothetical protein
MRISAATYLVAPVIATFLTSCGGQSVTPSTLVSGAAFPSSVAHRALTPPTGTWQGVIRVDNVKYEVTVTFQPYSEWNTDAANVVYGLPSNPSVCTATWTLDNTTSNSYIFAENSSAPCHPDYVKATPTNHGSRIHLAYSDTTQFGKTSLTARGTINPISP